MERKEKKRGHIRAQRKLERETEKGGRWRENEYMLETGKLLMTLFPELEFVLLFCSSRIEKYGLTWRRIILFFQRDFITFIIICTIQ